MEELVELRQYVEQQRYGEALDLIAEMEEMSREDKINKIRSYVRVLLLHLIKQAAEKRTTRSWDVAIHNVAREIAYVNQRRSSGGSYLTEVELREIIAESYHSALENASLEAFGGIYDESVLGPMVNRAEIEARAWKIIAGGPNGH